MYSKMLSLVFMEHFLSWPGRGAQVLDHPYNKMYINFINIYNYHTGRGLGCLTGTVSALVTVFVAPAVLCFGLFIFSWNSLIDRSKSMGYPCHSEPNIYFWGISRISENPESHWENATIRRFR